MQYTYVCICWYIFPFCRHMYFFVPISFRVCAADCSFISLHYNILYSLSSSHQGGYTIEHIRSLTVCFWCPAVTVLRSCSGRAWLMHTFLIMNADFNKIKWSSWTPHLKTCVHMYVYISLTIPFTSLCFNFAMLNAHCIHTYVHTNVLKQKVSTCSRHFNRLHILYR